MFASGKIIQLTAKLNPADTSLTADRDIGITNGRFYFKSDLQEEWISFTGLSASGSYFIYTGLTRGLSQVSNPATAGTGNTWLAGSIGTLVAMHDQIPDTKADNTFQGTNTFQQINATDIRFTGTTTSGLRIKSLTTTQRDALTPATGDKIINSTTGTEQTYYGGTWNDNASGTVSNASETVAGKVEKATSSQSISGTDTGETGAFTFVVPSDIAKNIQSSTFVYGTDTGGDDTYVVTLTPALTSYTTGQKLRFKVTTANTGACSVDFGPGVKSIKDKNGNDPVDGLVNGIVEVVYDGTNFVFDSSPVIASDAQFLTGTSEILIPNVKQTSMIFPGTSVTYFSSAGGSTSNTSFTTIATYTATKNGIYRVQMTGSFGYFGGTAGIIRATVDDIPLGGKGITNFWGCLYDVYSDSQTSTLYGEVALGIGQVINFQGMVAGSNTVYISGISIKGNK